MSPCWTQAQCRLGIERRYSADQDSRDDISMSLPGAVWDPGRSFPINVFRTEKHAAVQF